MSELCEFIMDKYYSRFMGNKDLIPLPEQMEQAIINHPDKFIVVKDGKIKGVGAFLALSDETFKNLPNIDIADVNVIKELVKEDGKNIHFVLVTADGLSTIMQGLREVISRVNPKTVSWWSPDFKRLHRFYLN